MPQAPGRLDSLDLGISTIHTQVDPEDHVGERWLVS